MPHRKTSLKTERKDKKIRLHNIKIKQDLKKAIKKYNKYISENNVSEAKSLLPKVISKLDKAYKKNILKKNTVSRKKSLLDRTLLKTTQTKKQPL